MPENAITPAPTPTPSAPERLSAWLASHSPESSDAFAPENTYCTKYVEDAIEKATGFDLYGAVQRDMAAHDPGLHIFGETRDGYRFSSSINPLSAGKDPYDSDNLAHYFGNHHELHPWRGNDGLQVGDVIFFHGGNDKALDHTAMVSKVDTNGHATQIAESTGSRVVYKSWSDFRANYLEQGKEPVEVGRPDLSNSR